MSTCEGPECSRRAASKGLCDAHAKQRRKGKDLVPLRPTARQGATLAERLATMSVESDGGCRLWARSTTHNGYGEISVNGKLIRAHRVAYELKFGDIPEGLVIDHICGNRSCINPTHLRAVTPGGNQQYRVAIDSRNSSGYRGVFFDSRLGKWRAHVMKDGARSYLGSFTTAEEADKVVTQWRRDHYELGEFDHEGQ